MKLSVLSVGTELLTGKVINTNTHAIGAYLKRMGHEIERQVAVHDRVEDIHRALDYLIKSDIIFVTGGLGPTHDDLTEHAFDLYFPGFKKTSIENHCGIAPGVHYTDGEKHVILVPGPPNECEGMLSELEPLIEKGNLERIDYKIAGLNEKYIEDRLLEHLKEDDFATYVGSGVCTVCLEHPNDELMRSLFGANYVNNDGRSLEEATIDLLKKLKLSILTVESVTCGMISSALTSVSGSSEVVYGNISPYMALAKEEILGIDPLDVERYTTVSPEMSHLLAESASRYGSDLVLAVTGYAEHTDPELHGLIHMELKTPRGVVKETIRYNSKSRERNRLRMVSGAIEFLREKLLQFYEDQV
ncbi:molybdopterin-binding protein [Guggenheimella bovis]